MNYHSFPIDESYIDWVYEDVKLQFRVYNHSEISDRNSDNNWHLLSICSIAGTVQGEVCIYIWIYLHVSSRDKLLSTYWVYF